MLDNSIVCNSSDAVIGLQLPLRGLSGTLPAAVLLALAPTLVYMDLRGNALTGARVGSRARKRMILQQNVWMWAGRPEGCFAGQTVGVAAAMSVRASAPPAPALHERCCCWHAAGNIPAAIGKAKNLQALFLNNNQFTGPLPYALGTLPKVSPSSRLHCHPPQPGLHSEQGGRGGDLFLLGLPLHFPASPPACGIRICLLDTMCGRTAVPAVRL